MKRHLLALPLAFSGLCSPALFADSLSDAIADDYQSHLSELFVYFHQNPELSFMENKTAARLAAELRDTGFEVTEGVGGTGLVAILENGPGPVVMMRA
ncbi:MAG: metal-dependent amidase/aminoacylase/carboxypeptidase family protein, partial [Glaciecola sp.]